MWPKTECNRLKDLGTDMDGYRIDIGTCSYRLPVPVTTVVVEILDSGFSMLDCGSPRRFRFRGQKAYTP